MSIRSFAPYRKRSIRFEEVAEAAGWRVKVYGISAHSDAVSSALMADARRLLEVALPQPAVNRGRIAPGEFERYGVAMLVVHEASEGLFVLIRWWCGENMTQQRVFFRSNSATTFADLTGTGLVCCVWEQAVFTFEREAWIEAVLAADSPDLEDYLSRSFSAYV